MSESIRPRFRLLVQEIEATRSLGMTSGQVYRRIIIPNAL